ncbi:hypothetical protein LC609_29810 [Nostoc sp. XA013]|nr:hypothetical protein [Nostoc sp. XA013]
MKWTTSRLLLRSPTLGKKLGDVYDGLRLRIKPSNPQLTIRVLCPNPDDCLLIKPIYEIVRSLSLNNTPLYIHTG